jgi:undecaprenyl diphosphate synthase
VNTMEQPLQHLAIILDGNRRWAKERGLPTLLGHKEGVEAVKRTIDACIKYGIKYFTVYAFSTENWKRAEEEVSYLMRLALENIGGGTDYFNERGVRVKIFGKLENLDTKLADAMKKTVVDTAANEVLNFNIGFNYGGRMEITEAVKKIILSQKKSDEVTEELISSYLYSAGQPDPDMIVRTSGEHRLSNFLPWQGIYSELYFPDCHWPDFDEAKVKEVIEEFTKRQRRFGK